MQPRTLSNDEVNAQILRSRQMLEQTQSQGSTPFAGSSYDVPQRTIQGTPSSIAIPGNEQTQISPDFNTRLIGLLKQYQTMGTKPFQEKAISGQQEQVQRQQTTPDDMIGASPSQQSAVRSDAVSAVQPTVDSAQQQGKTFGEQLNSFGDTVNTVQNMLKEQHAQQDKERDDARAIVQNAFTTFGSKATEILDPKIFKQAGYEASVLTNIKDTLKEKEMAQKLQISEQNKALRNSLTAGQINSSVNQIAGQFDNEPIVKNYNTAQEGFQTIKSIGVNTSSPADDIAFIYAFAKIMDPNSVVREGEYNTVQRYAQTWADNFGFTATRIFKNTNFLSADAKQKMLNALQPKINTLTTQYTNLNKEYQRQMDTAQQGGNRVLTDYAAGNTATQPQTVQMTGPAGTFNVPSDKVEVFKQNGYQ